MTRLTHFTTCISMVLALVITSLPAPAVAQPQETVFDLANVPLPVDDLQEPGYQVLTGGYLDRELTTHWIASPRNGDPDTVEDMLTNTGWIQSYVLDLVLLADRGWADSDILSLIQTNVYLFTDDDGAEEAADQLADYSHAEDADAVESEIQEASTVRLTSQSGDTYRSVARHERTVIEVISLERFGFADLEVHRRVLADTFDRLSDLHTMSSSGIGPHALLVGDGNAVADLFNTQQTGVHQVYRIRDGAVQPAAGELDAPETQGIAPGLAQLYQSGQVIQVGRGNGFYSAWIGEFLSEDEAASFVAGLPDSAPGALLPDPYFTRWSDEQTTSQGVAGLYRVTGSGVSGAFSGTLEIQQQGAFVIGIGWRTFGDVLPNVDVTSRLMDAQLTCLVAPEPCPAIPLAELMPPTSATPVVSGPATENVLASDEFGWSLAIDPAAWAVRERFSESGYDFLELQSGESLVTLESVIDQQGDPQECVLDEMNALQAFEEHAVIELGSDNPDEVPAGLEPGHGWGVYTVEPLADERADQEYTIRIDCYTIVAGEASLVMTQRAPRDSWDVERAKGEGLRDSLRLPVGPLGVAPDAMLDAQRLPVAAVHIANPWWQAA